MTTGDGGMLTTSQPGVGSPVPDVAPALDVGAGHHAARVAARRLRGVQRARIQLPPDRPAGGDRPRAAAAAARDGRRAGASSPAATTSCWPAFPTCSCPSSRPGRGATGRATASGCPPAAIRRGSCRRCSTTGISTRRGVMCAHREPAYQREAVAGGTPHTRSPISEEISDDGLILPLFGDMTDDDQVRVASPLARAIRTEDRQLCP